MKEFNQKWSNFQEKTLIWATLLHFYSQGENYIWENGLCLES